MKKSFKKIAASIIAATTLLVGTTGIITSATEITTPESSGIIERYSGPTGYVSFGSGATAGIYRDSSLIVLSTSGNSDVTVMLNTASYKSLSESVGTTYASVGGVSHSYTGSGITYSKGYHTANDGNDSIYTSR